ncbi:MAG: hypothetical protein KY439_06900 [Actinobacteria bacterium]|nr:hypothetical protein [Actinomycetota bacterium]
MGRRDEAVATAPAGAGPPSVSVIYCKNWNDLLRQPVKPMSEAAARRLHDESKPYVVFVHDVPGRRDAVVEVALYVPAVIVSFLDDNRQRSTTYGFKSDGDARLFLAEMVLRSFGPDDLAVESEQHRFSTDGLVVVTKTNFTTGEQHSWKQEIGDFTPLYEPVPSFGDYDSITRYER